MKVQKSFDREKGILYIVPTPIGNLEDMTFRAVRILKEADLIAAEDTRNTKKLLNYFQIKTPLTSYHEHNKESSGKKLIEQLSSGKNIALVSDAGMPAISDPGYELVRDAVQKGIHVVSLPGANAVITALVASGIPPQPFYFYGFLPRKKKEREHTLEKIKKIQAAIILYEAPHRIKETVKALHSVLGNRKITLCRELTKKYEEYIRGSLEEVSEWVQHNALRGEFCLIIEGATDDSEENEEGFWKTMDIVQHVEYYINNGLTAKDAIKQTAKDWKIGKRAVYQKYHIEKGNR